MGKASKLWNSVHFHKNVMVTTLVAAPLAVAIFLPAFGEPRGTPRFAYVLGVEDHKLVVRSEKNGVRSESQPYVAEAFASRERFGYPVRFFTKTWVCIHEMNIQWPPEFDGNLKALDEAVAEWHRKNPSGGIRGLVPQSTGTRASGGLSSEVSTNFDIGALVIDVVFWLASIAWLALFAASCVAAVRHGLRGRAARKRAELGICTNCGYELLETSTCPECGTKKPIERTTQ